MTLEAPRQGEKQQYWDTISAEVDHITDKLGKPIDEGIKHAIISLRVFNFETSMSCEGHKDQWGTGAPYIDIESKKAELLELEFRKKKDAGVSENELDEIIKNITFENLKERKRLIQFLEAYYKNRIVPEEQRLIPAGKGWGATRLESIGADLQKIEDTERQNESLKLYQEEMKTFSEFLKQTYFKE